LDLSLQGRNVTLLQSYKGTEINERGISRAAMVKLLSNIFSEVYSEAITWRTLSGIGFLLSGEQNLLA